MSHFLQALGRDGDAFGDALQERADLFGSGRTAKGDQQHRVVGQSHRLTSAGAKLMHRLDHGDDILDRSFGQNSMTEVKYMPRLAASASENFGDTSTDVLRRGKERCWIQVSLDAHIVSQVIPGRIKIHPPVYADHVAAGGTQRLEESSGAGAEIDDRNAWSQARNSGAGMGQNEPLVVFGRQAAGPTVEELYGFGSSCDLSIKIICGERRKSFHQAAPGAGIRIDEPLRFEIIAGAAALDKIRSESKRCASKANQGHFAVQGGANLAHGFKHKRKSFLDRKSVV